MPDEIVGYIGFAILMAGVLLAIGYLIEPWL